MTKTKKKSNFPVFLAVVAIILAAVLIYSVCFEETEPPVNNDTKIPQEFEQDLGTEQEDPEKHEDSTGENDGKEKEVYTLTCRFEGMIDENSFEVTEVVLNPQTGEQTDGEVVQVRIGNQSVRGDMEVVEIGEKIAVNCYYNSYSQLVAERVIFINHMEE